MLSTNFYAPTRNISSLACCPNVGKNIQMRMKFGTPQGLHYVQKTRA